MNWEVIDYKHKKVISKLPIQCKKKYAVFKYVAEFSGLDGLSSSPGFKLEMLKGKLSGLYSIRLNIAYRVVFDVQDEIRVIDILEVSKHEYNP
jgi:plasmid maintenance system killer protein